MSGAPDRSVASGLQRSFTVAVCTHDRSDSLRRLLEDLASQASAVSNWELVVVDNDSTDETRSCAESFRQALPLRIVSEPVRGLSFARNRAAREAESAIVLYTDDDMRLDPSWLESYAAAFARHQDAAFFGGRVVPRWIDGAPKWFREQTAALFSGIMGAYDLGAETRALRDDEPLPIGGSFAVRRELLAGEGAFRTNLGVVGRSRGRGEETELLGRLRASGALGIYVGDACCIHPVHRDAFSLEQLFRYGVASGVSHQRIAGGDGPTGLSRAALFLVKGAFQLLKGRGDRFRQCVLMAGVEVGAAREQRGLAR